MIVASAAKTLHAMPGKKTQLRTGKAAAFTGETLLQHGSGMADEVEDILFSVACEGAEQKIGGEVTDTFNGTPEQDIS